MLQWWLDWRKFGCFPLAGDALDQPVEVYEALWHCEGVRERLERENSRTSELDP